MGLGGKYLVYARYFYYYVFKVILRSFGTFPIFLIFTNLVSQKQLVVEQMNQNLGLVGSNLSVYEVLLTVKISKSV